MAVKFHAVLLAVGLVSVGALAILGIDPRPLQNPIVYVDDLGDCQGNTPCVTAIKPALGLVDPGGTVFVYGGTYGENLTIDIPVVIEGEGRDLVTIDAEWTTPFVALVRSDDVTLEEVTLVNADYGVEARSVSAVVLRGVAITDTYGGVLAVQTDGLAILDSDIHNVQAYDGVEVRDSRPVMVIQSNVSDNAGRGILVSGCQEVTIQGNVITGNALTGLNVSESVNVTVENNTIENNGGGGPVPFGGGPAPAPLNGDSGGLRFWQTDPTAVEYNVVRGNVGFGIEIAGDRSTEFILTGNQILNTLGSGLVIDGASMIGVQGGLISGNTDWGVLGLRATFVGVRGATISDNGVPPVPFTRSGDEPHPSQGTGGGLRFWQTDPSEIRGNMIEGNFGPAVMLEETVDFDVVDNMIETEGGEGIELVGAMSSVLSGNHVRSAIAGAGVGTALVRVDTVTVQGNTYVDLDTGILIEDGCHIRIGSNTFTNVVRPLELRGAPCDVTFAGNASLRFMPRTLNLRSEGQYVTLRFEVEGLDPSQFELATLTFDVNGAILSPPSGSPSTVTVHGGTIEAMVKLDRAECIAAFGTSGTYTVTVSGEIMPSVTWSASDTVDAILP